MVGEKIFHIVHPASADALIDEEDFDRNERLPYWADLWPSAIALARWLSNKDLRGKRVIELGCGLGLPSVVCLSRGAEVVVSDHYAAAMDFAVFNARTNEGREPETFLLDWRHPELDGLGLFDLVIGADVLYEALNGLALAELVPRLLSPRGEVIFADPNRNTAPVFLDEMENRGFQISTRSAIVEQDSREIKVLSYWLRNTKKKVGGMQGDS